MDALAAIRAKLPKFPGYDGEDERRLSDEYVRAYLGEALAALQARLGDSVDPRFEKALFRTEFANQVAFKPFENAELDQARIDAIAANDLRLIELAGRAASVDASGLEPYLNEVEAAFDERDRTMESLSP